MVEERKEPQGVKDRITELLERKYTRNQLINDFDFATSTVDTVIREYKESHGGEIPAHQIPAPVKFEVMKMETKQIVPPEQALQGIRLQDGDYKLGFQDGMGVLIMAARYNQILSASQSEILTNQIKIMEESRKGSMDMANEAAMRAAAGVGAQIMPEVQALKNQMIASSPNPMMSMFAQTMQPLLGQVMGNMMTMFQPKPGQAQPGAQAGQPGQPGAQQPAAGQQASQDEVKEAFND